MNNFVTHSKYLFMIAAHCVTEGSKGHHPWHFCRVGERQGEFGEEEGGCHSDDSI